METKTAILKELREISPVVAEIPSGPTYQVPAGYFENLAATILERVKTQTLTAKDELETLSPLLGGLPKIAPYQVPDGYFGDLAGSVIGGLKAVDFVQNELDEKAFLPEGLKDLQVYKVPNGYFENFASTVLDRINEREPAKVVTMNPARRIMRYAAAAVVAGVIVVSGWLYFSKEDAGSGDTSKVAAVETISDDSRISDDEMTNYLDNETDPIITAVSSEEMNASDIKEMLTDVSDDELQKYLITL